VRFSVTVVAEGDRVLTREEIVELADAVAVHEGIASGIGTATYGAQLVIEAATEEEAVELAVATLEAAARQAGLPAWPVERAEVIGEDDDWGDE
jgi:hypothetical protein